MGKVLGTTTILKSTFTPMPLFYLKTSSSYSLFPSSIRNRNGNSDPIRPMGLAKDHEFNLRWLRAARRVLKPDGTLWVTGTHHIIFSLGFALTLWCGTGVVERIRACSPRRCCSSKS